MWKIWKYNQDDLTTFRRRIYKPRRGCLKLLRPYGALIGTDNYPGVKTPGYRHFAPLGLVLTSSGIRPFNKFRVTQLYLVGADL